ncbi:MAG: cupin domain-containing protein [Bacteroidales bacterium]|jgi:mannose-6-phosphate isomerase-like protein (cupin superfamily)|nr:cupin domain-containing protein [Bacteroidales bacterium]
MKKTILTLILASGLTVALMAQNAAKNQDKWTITNCVTTLDPSKADKTNVGFQFWFADKNFLDGRTLKMSTVAPRQRVHAPHQHEEDEFFFVVEGSAKYYLNGDSIVVQPYTTFYAPPFSLHGIANAGDTELKYLVIKKYNLNK